MLRKILKIQSAKALTKMEQQALNGGLTGNCCKCILPTPRKPLVIVDQPCEYPCNGTLLPFGTGNC